jgi:hypothetical protein
MQIVAEGLSLTALDIKLGRANPVSEIREPPLRDTEELGGNRWSLCWSQR